MSEGELSLPSLKLRVQWNSSSHTGMELQFWEMKSVSNIYGYERAEGQTVTELYNTVYRDGQGVSVELCKIKEMLFLN